MNEQNQQNPSPNWDTPTMPPMGMWPWFYYMQNMQNMVNSGQASWNSRWGNQQNREPPAPRQQEKPPEQGETSNGPNISCRIISDINEVKPGEIPMDGSVGVFVKSDLSCAYIKQWGSDGVLHTKTFIEDVQKPVTQTIPNDLLEKIDARFKNLEEAIHILSQSATVNASDCADGSTKKSKNGGK